MTDIIQRADALIEKWLAHGGKISQDTADTLRAMRADVARLRACEQLARDLLDPERLGFADPIEIRDEARRALGITPVEVRLAMTSFNESAARRDALNWPRGSLGEEVADNAKVSGVPPQD